MISYHAKKMFGGRVSVRSYHIEYIKKMKQNLKLIYDGREMIITPHTQYTCDERLHRAKKTDKYIKKGDYYKLYDYVFNPRVHQSMEETWDGVKAKFTAMGEALGKFRAKPKQEKLI